MTDPASGVEYDHLARAAAYSQVARIEAWMNKHRRQGAAAREYILYLIDQGLNWED